MRPGDLSRLALVLLFVYCCECEEGASHKHIEDEEQSNGALVSIEVEDDSGDDSTGGADMNFVSDSAEMFQPTKEWQKVKPGQIIPKGLHVRLNLQTGDKEAKLMDDGDDGLNPSKQPPGEPSHETRMRTALEEAMRDLEAAASDDNTGDSTDDMKRSKNAGREGMADMKNRHFTREELKKALKKFKVARDDVGQPSSDAKKKFRTMEEIRKDFDSLKLNVKTDLELLTETLQRYRKGDFDLESHKAILADLEYWLHQIDNAKNFADMGGLPLVVADLNSTNEDIRSAAALVISSAVQSNPSVQVSAIEAGVMQQLIRMLSTDASISVRTRSLAALSSLVRQFPYAQRKFVDLGGLQALTDLLTHHSSATGMEKMCVKAVTLVNDLLQERTSVRAEAEVDNDSDRLDNTAVERIRQYAQVPLLESIVEHGWCKLVPQLLNIPEHDSREKVLNLMWAVHIPCRSEFSHYIGTLESLKLEYRNLSKQEVKDVSGDADVSYFAELLQTVDKMIQVFSAAIKDEL